MLFQDLFLFCFIVKYLKEQYQCMPTTSPIKIVEAGSINPQMNRKRKEKNNNRNNTYMNPLCLLFIAIEKVGGDCRSRGTGTDKYLWHNRNRNQPWGARGRVQRKIYQHVHWDRSTFKHSSQKKSTGKVTLRWEWGTACEEPRSKEARLLLWHSGGLGR